MDPCLHDYLIQQSQDPLTSWEASGKKMKEPHTVNMAAPGEAGPVHYLSLYLSNRSDFEVT